MACCGGNESGKCCGGKGRQAKSSSSSSGSASESTKVTVTGDESVALPSRKHKGGADVTPVWSLQAAGHKQGSRSPSPTPSKRREQVERLLDDPVPLASKCAAHGREGGVCCKDLKGDDERTLIDPDIVRDVIIGLSDGLTVPFALTAGLSSIGSSRLVVLGGLAELIAGAISMGLGGYLASQAEMDHFHYLRRQTHARVARSCSGEMEREVHGILGPVGVEESLSRLVAESLREVEEDMCREVGEGEEWDTAAGGEQGVVRPGVGAGSVAGRKGDAQKGFLASFGWNKASQGQEEEAGGLKWSEDVGLTAFLLKFGEGMEEVPRSRLYISAITIGLSYFIGGLVPLVPYFFVSTATTGLIVSSILTGVILLIFGAFKTYFTGATGGAGGYAWGAISTMLVGGLAAGAAFAIVKLLEVHE